MVAIVRRLLFKIGYLSIVLWICVSLPAFGQNTNVNGYNLELFHPVTDDAGAFSVAGSGTLKHMQTHLGLTTNFSRGLISAGNPVNNQTVDIVDSFFTGDFLFGLGLWNRLGVGVDIPVFFYERGRDFNNAAVFNTSGVGDVRLDAKIRLFEDEGKRPGAALLSSAFFPSGETSKFTGSKNVEYEARLIVDKKFKHLYLTANAGYKVAPRQTAVNIIHDDELTFGAGARFPLPILDRSIEFVSEVFGATVVRNFSELTTPVEFIGGVRKKFKNNLSLSVAGGTGLTSGAGAPQYRTLMGLAYTFGPRPVPPPAAEAEKSGRQTVYFGFDSYLITPESAKILDDMAGQIRRESIKISGHSDSTGPKKYNMALSERRAVVVKDYLVEKGVSPEQVTIESFGETMPIAANSARGGRSRNRRVEIEQNGWEGKK